MARLHMLLAWEALLAQAQVNRVAAEAQRDAAQACRITAEAMLIALRKAKGCCGVPCQEDELQAWFHDAQGVAAITQVSSDLAVGPHTPSPRRCRDEHHSTPPKTTLFWEGSRTVAFCAGAWYGEKGPPTQCVTHIFNLQRWSRWDQNC